MKFRLLLILLVLVTISSASCEKETEDIPEKAVIYFRWKQDLNYPSCGGCGAWCDIKSGNFRDNNNAVPDNAEENRFYGPCEPGSYNLEFDFDANNPTTPTTKGTYKLEKPADGFNRFYTKNLRLYNFSLNRCISVALEQTSITYFDEKR